MNAKRFNGKLWALAAAFLAGAGIADASSVTVSQSSDANADIMLQSYSAGGHTYSNFITVNNANLLFTSPSNLPAYDNRTGTFSVDKGLHASGIGPFENPTNADIATHLGNVNLNNIIDVEENGQFAVNLMFSKTVKASAAKADGIGELLVFERGKNSDVNIQALDANGNLIGNAIRLVRSNHAGSTQEDVGFDIHTTETSQQREGLWAVDLRDLGVDSLAGVQMSVPQGSTDYNGPDFKVIGVDTGSDGPIDPPNHMPEPSTGLLIVLAAASSLGAARLRSK